MRLPRTAARASSSRSLNSAPSTVTLPLLGLSNPANKANNVDFPEPELPTIATLSPCVTDKCKSRRMLIGLLASPTVLAKFVAKITACCVKDLFIFAQKVIVMRVRFLIILISVIVMGLVAFSASAKLIAPIAKAAPQTILVFGDSLSAGYGVPQEQGWVALLEQRVIKQKLNFSVINASISGETTSGGLARFAEALKTHKPNIVILELGANDGLRGLPVKEMQANLSQMIAQAKTVKAKVLLIGMKIPPNYGLKYTKNFTQMYVNLAKQNCLSAFFAGRRGRQA
jgi:acyl-CoA thioesterase I